MPGLGVSQPPAALPKEAKHPKSKSHHFWAKSQKRYFAILLLSDLVLSNFANQSLKLHYKRNYHQFIKNNNLIIKFLSHHAIFSPYVSPLVQKPAFSP